MLMAEIKAHEKTDRKLQKAKELAEAANQAKSRYLTGLSHELRSPLNAAFGYAQLLENDPSIPENRRGAVAAIRRSTGHLSDLIEGLLEISKIEAGRLELYRNRVRVRSLIDELVTMFQLQAEEKGIGFEFHSQGRIPEWVTTDEKRLRQVLINLLRNALDATAGNRGSSAVVTVSSATGDGGSVEISVSDSGEGINGAAVEELFEPFFTTKKDGLGMGLAISRSIVESHGGRIWADEVAEGGLKVSFSLRPESDTAERRDGN